MADRIRGFFKTALDNLIAYRAVQMRRYAVRPIDGTRERTRHTNYYV
ncbi:hypothetical protein [Phyllobacterium lublinensis]|jgi:hypothetical protein|nr:hypothetical protein [Phyllobacterium sp. 2063]MBZ9657018.1 hypothetical protein [Phyllobacterium sp. 2063]